MKLPSLLVACLVALRVHASAATNQPGATIVTYPGPEGISPSRHYEVEVLQGGTSRKSFVYEVRSQWKTNPHKDTSWTSFSFSEKVTVRVTAKAAKVHAARVLPSSAGIKPRLEGNTAVFELDRPRQLSVEFDGGPEVHPMLVFADPIETEIPREGDAGVIWFKPGVHELKEDLRVKRGETVYLAGGAYVKGRIIGDDATDVRIIGRGILSGERFLRDANDPHKNMPDHLLKVSGWSTKRARVEGITMIQSPHYNLILAGQSNVVRNVKMISWWFGTDGVGMGEGGLVEDCFFKVNDDALKLYHSGMTVRRCTIWQMENGAPFQISWNMPTDNRGFHVSDCDVFRVEHKWDNDNEAVFCAIHGGRGTMSDYLFENIRIENARWRLVSLQIKPNEFAQGVTTPGNLSGITFRNISADGPFQKPNRIRGHGPQSRIKDVRIENVRVGGKPLVYSPDAFDIDTNFVEGVTWSPKQ